MPLSPELLAIIVCPVDKQKLQLLADQSGLECTVCHRVYPIQDGIPILLKDRAVQRA
jgi:uncharacterized protein YbaR (Trm112 family)